MQMNLVPQSHSYHPGSFSVAIVPVVKYMEMYILDDLYLEVYILDDLYLDVYMLKYMFMKV